MPRTLADRLAALSRVGTALIRHVEEAAVLHLCAQTACDLTDAAFAAVIVRPVTEEQEEAEPLVPREGAGFQLAVVVGATQEQEAFLHRVLLTREELFAPLFEQGKPVRVADIVPLFSPAEVPPHAAGHALVRSFLGAPLLDHAGQLRGGLLLGHGESGHFRQEDETLLMNLAAQTALALERARFARLAERRDQQRRVVLDKRAEDASRLDTHESLVRDSGAAPQVRERLQDRTEGEQALAARLQEAEPEARQRAGQLEAVFETVPDALLVYDRQGRLTQMNAAGHQLYERLGLSDSTTAPLMERAAQVAIWGDHGNLLAKESLPLARILAGEVLSSAKAVVITLLDRQAERISLSVTGGPLRDVHGQLVGAVISARGTTTQHHSLEQALQQQAQQRRYQLLLQDKLLERAYDAILVCDQYNRIRSWNRGAELLYGWSAQEVLGQVSHELLQTCFPVSLREAEADLEREGQWEGELWHTCRDGTQVLVESRWVLVREAQGVSRAILEINRDMTERHRMQQHLQEAEHQAKERASQLEAIVEAMPEALVVYDREGRITQMNTAGQQLYERLGLSESTAAPLASRVAQLTMWDEHGQPLASESLPTARILAGEVVGPAQAMEISLLDRQGERVCSSVTGGPLRDTQGHLVGAVTISRDITERNQAERTLRQQAQQLQLQAELIEQAHDAILVRDPDSRIRSWNRGAEHLYGWSAQEALGHVTHDLLQTRFPVSLADVEAHLQREGQWEGELRHRCRDGAEVLVESRHVLVRDAGGRPTAILEINRDITQRRRLEALQQQLHEAMQAQLRLLQLVVDELPSSVCLVYGPDALLLLANRATEALWGVSWTPHQPLGAFLHEHGIRLLGPDGKVLPPEQQVLWRVLREGQAVHHYQEIICQPNGQKLSVLVNAVPLTLSPLLLGPEEVSWSTPLLPEPAVLVVYQDVTALKEAERLKDEFLGIAAHELRTPLAVLSSAAQTLHFQQQRGRGVPLDEWQREALVTIEEATQQLVALSDALLDITRLQGGRLQVRPEPVDLVALSRRVIKHLQRTTQRHRLSLHTSQDQLLIALDAARMEQVLTNLLSNAIKYSPQGGPVEVTIWVEREAGEVALSVRDEGIGIPAQQQATIFGRFVRASNARAIAGTGLGLYLCRSLVELHGGRLWFESIEGQGSTFFLALPTDREAVALD